MPLWIWVALIATLLEALILLRRKRAKLAAFNQVGLDVASRHYNDKALVQGASETRIDTLSSDHAAGSPEIVVAAAFDLAFEADMARALLSSEGIPTFLADEYTHNNIGGAHGGLRLFVPAQLLTEAQAILHSGVSDEELAAQAEASSKEDEPAGE